MWRFPWLATQVIILFPYRFWQSLSAVTCCRSLVIVYDGICILQVGVAAKAYSGDGAQTVDATKLIEGALYGGVMKSGARKMVKLIIRFS